MTEEKSTLEKMLEELKEAGKSHGYMSDGKSVWIRGPGSPWRDSPTLYTKDDLDNAISSGKLREQKMAGSYTWTFYVLA